MADRILSARDYEARAQMHRPTNPDDIRREVLRMHRDGLRPRDIASCLRMNDHDVVQIIAREML